MTKPPGLQPRWFAIIDVDAHKVVRSYKHHAVIAEVRDNGK